ncbi:hypothetical protein CWI37_0029p0030 [Hamiltosporidium tvaerminnensis]|uniref:Uncharacterized protein n=1 Tax=Hamiltosporidium tvaerminnensis TaxID=1176355 RepID=A0A4Q9LCY2_9MICR|nr:hypothetical protein LUQ84_003186 [Hamiltosporidium tvaerminnensis]TBU05265.1 hypothetical protein CWI37_0029p0030 [Hamiltosporidium tvaerminnensis]
MLLLYIIIVSSINIHDFLDKKVIVTPIDQMNLHMIRHQRGLTLQEGSVVPNNIDNVYINKVDNNMYNVTVGGVRICQKKSKTKPLADCLQGENVKLTWYIKPKKDGFAFKGDYILWPLDIRRMCITRDGNTLTLEKCRKDYKNQIFHIELQTDGKKPSNDLKKKEKKPSSSSSSSDSDENKKKGGHPSSSKPSHEDKKEPEIYDPQDPKDPSYIEAHKPTPDTPKDPTNPQQPNTPTDPSHPQPKPDVLKDPEYSPPIITKDGDRVDLSGIKSPSGKKCVRKVINNCKESKPGSGKPHISYKAISKPSNTYQHSSYSGSYPSSYSYSHYYHG